MNGFFTARYRIESTAQDIDARASALAIEQSVELPLAAIRDRRVRESVVARVQGIDAESDGVFEVSIAFAIETTGFEASQLLNVLFGNCSLQPDVQLVDAEVPEPLARALGGPRFGIAGVRASTGVAGRAMTCSALKPQGLSPAQLAELAGKLVRGGVDVVKDDHGIADQSYAPFAQRVAAVQRAVSQANRERGTRAAYAPTLSGAPAQLREQARLLADQGVGMALACPALIGLPSFRELVRDQLAVPVLAHPAFAGGGVAPALLLGRLYRLFGADAVIFPNHGGRFSYTAPECGRIADRARSPLHGVLPALPVPAGGMSVERVDEMIEFYGSDVMMLVGGDVLGADDVESRAREFSVRVRRAAEGER